MKRTINRIRFTLILPIIWLMVGLGLLAMIIGGEVALDAWDDFIKKSNEEIKK